MKDKSFTQKFIAMLKLRYPILLVTIAIFAILIGGEKYLSSSNEPIYQAGDAYAQRLAYIEFYDQRPYTDNKDFFTNSELAMVQFINQTSDHIEWNRYNRNWDGMDIVNKLKWFFKRMRVDRFDPNFYLFQVTVLSEDVGDIPYINSTIKDLADEYVEFAQTRLEQTGVGRLIVVDSAEVISDPQPISKKRIVLKYFVIGGILGAIIGTILIGAMASRTSKNV